MLMIQCWKLLHLVAGGKKKNLIVIAIKLSVDIRSRREMNEQVERRVIDFINFGNQIDPRSYIDLIPIKLNRNRI